jgi:tetratricopeptide (TPR) repeat protein
VLERGIDLGEMDGRSLFEHLVQGPLSHPVDGGHECVCLVVDAIDEAGTTAQNELAEVLGACTDTLPQFVKVLVTSREVPSALAPFMGDALRIQMEEEPVRNASDVFDYLRSSLSDHEVEKGFYRHIGAMTHASKGSFLYAKHMVDAVQRGKVTLADATAALPKGLPKLFYQWFQWTFPDLGLYRREIRGALGCVASAPGGKLPLAELQLLMGWDGNKTSDLLHDAGVFLERTADPLGGQSVSIAHAFVSEWLASPEACNYHCDPQSALRFMGERYYKTALEDAARLTDWEAAHILGVLESAGMHDELATVWSIDGFSGRCLDAAIELRKSNALIGAADALRPLRRFARESSDCNDDLKARILNEHANQLRLVGRIGEAITAYESALRLRKDLAAADPAFLSDYADSLNNCGCILQEVGKKDDAEHMLREALSVYRGLAREDPDAYAPGVAKVLGNLGTLLRQTNRLGVAEEEYRESIETFLRCADTDASCTRYAAHMQDRLGMLLYETGRSPEAEKEVREALRIRRELAATNRGAYLPDVASSYSSLSKILLGLSRVEDAERYIRQALDIYYELAESEASAFTPQLADCLYHLGACLSAGNLKGDALLRYDEALDIWRDLAEKEPDMYLPFVAQSLCGVGNTMREMGDMEGARGRLEEAVDICRSLVSAGKRQYLSLLATSLNALGIVMCRVDGGIGPAEEMVLEAVRIRRRLAEAEPVRWLPSVAESLNSLGGIHVTAGRLDEAERALGKAIETYRKLAGLEQAVGAGARAALPQRIQLDAVGHVKPAGALGPQQRLVARKGVQVALEGPHVHRHGTQRLRAVDQTAHAL